MTDPIIKQYGDHWERNKIFLVESGTVKWTEMGWPENDPPLKGVKGLYVLYRGDKPIYVGIGLTGVDPIADRIQTHARDWLAPWWDSVCWYDFGENVETAQLIESFLISHGIGLWNGADSGGNLFGKQVFLEGDNSASIDLWKGKKS